VRVKRRHGRDVRSRASSGGGFSYQAGQGGQVEPDVSLKGKRLAPEVAVDGQSLEAPPLEGGVASLGGISGAVVEAFPGRSAHGDVSYQADGAIPSTGSGHRFEALAQVDELAVGMVEEGAVVRRVGSLFDGDDGRSAVATGMEAGPLVTPAVEAVS
jgi:hypothetical protein